VLLGNIYPDAQKTWVYRCLSKSPVRTPEFFFFPRLSLPVFSRIIIPYLPKNPLPFFIPSSPLAFLLPQTKPFPPPPPNFSHPHSTFHPFCFCSNTTRNPPPLSFFFFPVDRVQIRGIIRRTTEVKKTGAGRCRKWAIYVKMH